MREFHKTASILTLDFCFLVLFVDFGENYSVLDRITLTFDYSEIGNPNKKLKGRIGNMVRREPFNF